MQQYEDFDIADFLEDEYFIRWVRTPDETSNRFWYNWLRIHPDKKQVVAQAAAVINSVQSSATPVPEVYYTSLKARIDATLQEDSQPATRIQHLWRNIRIAAAVAVLILAGTLTFFLLQYTSTTTIITKYGETSAIWLPDSSRVILNADSRLTYRNSWHHHKREIWLEGEAFLQVRQPSLQQGTPPPFTVHAGAVNIAVLGTEFNVSNRDVAAVMLKSGKVRVDIASTGKKLVMRPHEYMHYNKSSGALIVKTVDPAVYTAWINHQLIFEQESLKNVCDRLQRYFGTPFIIQDSRMQDIKISGIIELNNEATVISTLSGLLNTDVRKTNNQIIITGN
ncbi:FecR family protein [Chitinophaga nivalis]|uniref:FecR domain-containing protein n=1 Tax=Chitinophaga nivalis TaxID=2991709 RepID=A0ABT3IS30_9BACT|nr:FecR domain-containing protein [Chitinophaga nivalis]MCW3463527.1 FecR domain-containing protein [Chitinophaga nivalis]MCW3486783.1 FecR domain-containing protein [Chitinophaga nivalis]